MLLSKLDNSDKGLFQSFNARTDSFVKFEIMQVNGALTELFDKEILGRIRCYVQKQFNVLNFLDEMITLIKAGPEVMKIFETGQAGLTEFITRSSSKI